MYNRFVKSKKLQDENFKCYDEQDKCIKMEVVQIIKSSESQQVKKGTLEINP